MTMLIWIAMQSLCALSLLVYALFPSHLEYGAVLTTTLNALLVGFMWYVIIAFESSGWRDSFYYAFAGWLVVWGCRAASRTILISAIPLQLDSLVINTAIGCVLVLSVQVIFAQFIRTTNLENRNLAKSFEALHQTDAALLEQTREKLRETAAPGASLPIIRPLSRLWASTATSRSRDIRYALHGAQCP